MGCDFHPSSSANDDCPATAGGHIEFVAAHGEGILHKSLGEVHEGNRRQRFNQASQTLTTKKINMWGWTTINC
jgi:hypothetical protein